MAYMHIQRYTYIDNTRYKSWVYEANKYDMWVCPEVRITPKLFKWKKHSGNPWELGLLWSSLNPFCIGFPPTDGKVNHHRLQLPPGNQTWQSKIQHSWMNFPTKFYLVRAFSIATFDCQRVRENLSVSLIGDDHFP